MIVDASFSFNSAGRLIQLEYAYKAVEKGGDIIVLKCLDGVLILTSTFPSKPKQSSLITFNQDKIKKLPNKALLISSGLVGDVRYIEKKVVELCQEHMRIFGADSPIKLLVNKVASLMHEHTLSSGQRPIAATCCFLTHSEKQGFQIFNVEPSGSWHECEAFCTGYRVEGLLGKWPKEEKLEKCKVDQILPRLAALKRDCDLDLTDEDDSPFVDCQIHLLRKDNILEDITATALKIK